MPDIRGDQNGKNIKETKKFVTHHWVEFLVGALMLIGIITTFFHRQIGGALVGFAFGVYFFDAIYHYFVNLRSFHETHGTFRTLMLIGAAVYFLVTVPAFIIACAIGLGIVYLLRGRYERPHI